MARRTRGLPVEADYTVNTLELNREELMIILNGIKCNHITRAKRKLQFLRERRNQMKAGRCQLRESNPPILWRHYKKIVRIYINGKL